MKFEDLAKGLAPSWGRTILVALNHRAIVAGGHIYAGTVPAGVVAKRRARDKAARAARRIARRRG